MPKDNDTVAQVRAGAIAANAAHAAKPEEAPLIGLVPKTAADLAYDAPAPAISVVELVDNVPAAGAADRSSHQVAMLRAAKDVSFAATPIGVVVKGAKWSGLIPWARIRRVVYAG